MSISLTGVNIMDSYKQDGELGTASYKFPNILDEEVCQDGINDGEIAIFANSRKKTTIYFVVLLIIPIFVAKILHSYIITILQTNLNKFDLSTSLITKQQ